MAQRCHICNHKWRTQIEAALAANMPKTRIAADFDVAETTLRRHAEHCMKQAFQTVLQDQQQATGLNLLERLLRDAELVDAALKKVWGEDEKSVQDVDKLLKVLNLSLQQHRFYAEWQRDKTVDELAARLAELEQQLAAVLARRLA